MLDAAAPPPGVHRGEAQVVGGRVHDRLGGELDPLALAPGDALVGAARGDLAGRVRQREADAQRSGRAAHAGRHEDADLARCGVRQRVRGEADGQAGIHERRAEGGRQQLLGSRRGGGDAEQSAGAHRGLGPGDRDLDVVAAAVAVPGLRLEAEQVVAHHLARDPLEGGFPRTDDAQHGPARLRGEVVEPRRLDLPVLHGGDRRVVERRVRRGGVEEDHEQRHAGPGRGDPEIAQLAGRLRAQALRDEDEGLRALDALEAPEGRPEGRLGGEGPLAVLHVDERGLVLQVQVALHRPRLRDGGRTVGLDELPGLRHEPSALRLEELLPAHAVVELDVGDGLGQRHAESGAVRLAHHSLQAPPHVLDLGGELDARPGARYEGEPHAVAGGQRVEEALGPLEHLAALAPADVAAIDQQQDQPASRSVLVAAEVRRAGPGRRGRLEVAAHVLDRHEAAGLAVHLDLEVPGAEPEHRPSVRVHDARVHRHDVDAHAEHGGLRRRALGRLRRRPGGGRQDRCDHVWDLPHGHLPRAVAR